MPFMMPLPAAQNGQLRDNELPRSAKAAEHRNSPSEAQNDINFPSEDKNQNSAAQGLTAAAISTRHVVFPDPVAFRFLENEPHVSIVERQTHLTGYELYLVEQWVCSRKSPTLVVATYTGDNNDRIVVGILAIPQDNALWSAKLQLYFKAANQYHARPKETDAGQLLVTNLGNFPSSLTVIPVPFGDVRKHRQTFIVNQDLKRLGCSGRSGLTLTEPPEATISKFHQLYKISDRIPFMQAVTKLVKLCQVALYMFDKLEPEYIDGLLCDITETAIRDWWTEIGTEHYNYEPSDGILGPSTVAALLGMLMGARNRLGWQGAPVSKDVFDIGSTKRGISYFQKSQKLDKTRRLDRQTLFRLHNTTAKAAAGEGWGVQKAVKSTVTEIGGKRGEIVMDMVSGKDRGGLADIETLDLDKFVKLVYGEQPKWLWYGKQPRASLDSPDLDHELGQLSFAKGDASMPVTRKPASQSNDDDTSGKRPDESLSLPASRIGTSATYDVSDREGTRKTVFQSVAGNAKSGLGRIKDAVGGSRKGHGRWPSTSTRDDVPESPRHNLVTDGMHASGVATGPAVLGRAFTWKETPEEYLGALRRGDSVTPGGMQGNVPEPVLADAAGSRGKAQLSHVLKNSDTGLINAKGPETREASTVSSAVRSPLNKNDAEGPPLETEGLGGRKYISPFRRYSLPDPANVENRVANENCYPRRMSFADAEEAILDWQDINPIMDVCSDDNAAPAQTEALAKLARQVDLVATSIGPWVKSQIELVQALDERHAKDVSEVQGLHRRLREEYERVQRDADGVMAEERQSLGRSIGDVETLAARLEYEMNALAAKVHEVEEGIVHFERQVVDVETRAEELKTQLETESWLHWFVRTLTGVGTGPNITRSG